jgi:hypothetical protein
MKAIIPWGGGVLATLLLTTAAHAQVWVTPVTKQPILPAPDMCGPGWYYVNDYGTVLGPAYNVVPPWAPYNGYRPPLKTTGPATQAAGYALPNGAPLGVAPQQQGPPVQTYFPTHPYARGPRDFFMFNENLEDIRGRDYRPNIVP